MLDSDFLFEKYKEKIHCVKTRNEPLATLKELVDVKETPISIIYKEHLEMLKINVLHSIYARKEKKIEFRLFYVADNSKSNIYYQSYAKKSNHTPWIKERNNLYYLRGVTRDYGNKLQFISYRL